MNNNQSFITMSANDMKDLLNNSYHATIHGINETKIQGETETIITFIFTLPEPLTIEKLRESALVIIDNLLNADTLIDGQDGNGGDLCIITLLF